MMLVACGRSSYLDYAINAILESGLRRGERAKAAHRAALSIVNEATVDCGENIGGASDAQSAPEATSDGDGDGDGDDDPEPERRPRRHITTRKTHLASNSARRCAPTPDALTNFPLLPDDAHVRLPVVTGLFACSPATVWRRVKSGAIPAPRKLSERLTAWRVGDLRAALASLSQ